MVSDRRIMNILTVRNISNNDRMLMYSTLTPMAYFLLASIFLQEYIVFLFFVFCLITPYQNRKSFITMIKIRNSEEHTGSALLIFMYIPLMVYALCGLFFFLYNDSAQSIIFIFEIICTKLIWLIYLNKIHKGECLGYRYEFNYIKYLTGDIIGDILIGIASYFNYTYINQFIFLAMIKQAILYVTWISYIEYTINHPLIADVPRVAVEGNRVEGAV